MKLTKSLQAIKQALDLSDIQHFAIQNKEGKGSEKYSKDDKDAFLKKNYMTRDKNKFEVQKNDQSFLKHRGNYERLTLSSGRTAETEKKLANTAQHESFG